MSELSSAEINHLAELARLELTVSEKADFSEQLPTIVNFVDQLGSIKTAGNKNPQTSIPLEKTREDVPGKIGLTIVEIKKMAPEFQDSQVVVPAVLGGSDD